MLAVKANYENGKVIFSEPFPKNVEKANLIIFIQSEDEEKSMDDFHLIGYDIFF